MLSQILYLGLIIIDGSVRPLTDSLEKCVGTGWAKIGCPIGSNELQPGGSDICRISTAGEEFPFPGEEGVEYTNYTKCCNERNSILDLCDKMEL